METLVVARVRPRLEADRSSSGSSGARINVDRDTVSTESARCEFHKVFPADCTNQTLYDKVGRPLARSFARGYNVAAVVLGETSSGRATTLAGRHGEEDSFLRYLAADIFAALDDDKMFTITVQCCELLAKNIRDLLEPEARNLKVSWAASIDSTTVVETAEQGVHVRGLSKTQVRSAVEVNRAIELSLAARTEDPSWLAASALFIQLDLQQGDLTSQCRIVLLPAAEVLVADPSRAQQRHQLEATKSMRTFASLITTLAARSEQDIDAKAVVADNLTHLLQPCFGGNFQTAALVTLKQHASPALPAVLDLAAKLRKVTSYPIINDRLTRGLLQRLKAASLALMAHMTSASTAYNEDDEEKRLAADVALLELRQDNSKLTARLLDLRTKCDRLEREKAELNLSLLQSEEDRLDVSRALIDMQAEALQTKDESDSQAKQAAEQIAALNAQIEQLQQELDESQTAQEHLRENLRQLTAEKAELEVQHQALQEEHRSAAEFQTLNSEWRQDLASRIGALVQSKVAVMKERDRYAAQLLVQSGMSTKESAVAETASRLEIVRVEQEGRDLQAFCLGDKAATASKTSQPGPLPSLRRPSSSGLGATAADSASAAAMKQWEKERAALLAAKIGAEERCARYQQYIAELLKNNELRR